MLADHADLVGDEVCAIEADAEPNQNLEAVLHANFNQNDWVSRLKSYVQTDPRNWPIMEISPPAAMASMKA